MIQPEDTDPEAEEGHEQNENNKSKNKRVHVIPSWEYGEVASVPQAGSRTI